MPLTDAAPNAKRAVGSGAFVDQPVIVTGPVDPLKEWVPTYREALLLQVASIAPVAPFAGMHESVRWTSVVVTVPSTCTSGVGLPQLVCTAPTIGEKGWLVKPADPAVHALMFRGVGSGN